jgi:hypothetical protein
MLLRERFAAPATSDVDDKRRLRVCAVKGGAFQWVKAPPGEEAGTGCDSTVAID